MPLIREEEHNDNCAPKECPQDVIRNARQNNATIFDENTRQIMPQYAIKRRTNNGHNKCDKKAQANTRKLSPAKSAYLLATFLEPHSLYK